MLSLYDEVGGQNRSVYFVYNNDVARGIYTLPDASHFQSVVESLDINNLKGLKVEMIYNWRVGDTVIMDRSHIHSASTRLKEKKLGLTTFTKK